MIGALAGRDVLLVVDNFEHLLEATELLVELLTECPHLTLLVTSRSPLRVRAEHIYEVGPLEVPADDADGRRGGRRVGRRALRRSAPPRCGRVSR